MIRILGTGGLAREVQAHMALQLESFLVDSRDADKDDGRPTIIAIGDPATKKRIEQEFKGYSGYWWSWVGDQTHIKDEPGLIICPGVQITTNVTFGRHVLVNLNATIGHDCVIGDYVTINPGANISGNVTIGEGCLIGTGATIIEKITIAPWTVIGAGAVVVSDITEPGTYVGVPAKRIK